MKFLTVAEKLKSTRKYLKMKQEDLAEEDLTRGLISMMEIGKRGLSPNTAIKIAQKFQQKAKDLGIEFKIDEGFLLRSPSDDAELYCLKMIQANNIDNDIKEILEIANKFNLLEVKAKGYHKLGDNSFDKKDYNKAFIEYNQAIPLYKDLNHNEIIPYLYWRIGLCKERNFEYEDALTYFKICENYLVIYSDSRTQQLVLYDKALCYKKTDNLELALQDIDKYLIFNSKEENSHFYIYANILKANCYRDMGKTELAIETYDYLLSTILQNEVPSLGLIYNNLGLVYLDKNDFKTSLQFFEKSEQIRSINDMANLSHTLIEKSEFFFRQCLYDDAIKTIELGLTSAQVYNDYEYLLKGNYSLAIIYERMEDNSNLKNIYLTIADLLKIKNNFSELTSIYVKLSIMYLDENNIEKAKGCLILSQNNPI